MWRIFTVGGDPKNEAFVSKDLYNEVNNLQKFGWKIRSIDKNDISRAWNNDSQTYEKTYEYIIIATTDED